MYLYKKNDSHGLYKTKLDGSQHTFVQGSQYKKTDIFLMSTQLSMRLLESLAGLTKSALPDAELNSHKDSEKEGMIWIIITGKTFGNYFIFARR